MRRLIVVAATWVIVAVVGMSGIALAASPTPVYDTDVAGKGLLGIPVDLRCDSFLGYYLNVTIDGAPVDASAGLIYFTPSGQDTPVNRMCIDLIQDVYLGSTSPFVEYAPIGKIGGLANQIDAVAALPGTTPAELAVKQAEAAGLDLAIWETDYDGYTGSPVDFTSGRFRVADNSQAAAEAIAYANQFISQYGNQTAPYVLDHSDIYQDQLGSDPPIPEPAFYQLSVLLLLGGCSWMRRRKVRG